jgi:hypothetical protein
LAERAPRLILEIDTGKLLPIVVAHDKAGFQFLDGPGGREAAGVGYAVIASGKPKYRDHRQNKNVKRKSARA